MNLAIVSGGGYIAGKEVVSLELANGLRDAGFNLEIVITKWTNGEFPRELKTLGHRYTSMRLGYISATPRFNEARMTAHQLVYLPALWSSYARFLKRFRPRKVVHTNWHHLLLLVPFLKPNRDLFWVHEIIPDKPQYRKLFAMFARRLSAFVAVSDAVRRSIIDLGVSQNQVVVIHNGVSPFEIEQGSRDSSKVRIGIVGQVGEWKGHEDLIAAFAEIAPRFPQCELHIFGAETGSFAEKLRSLIGELNLSGRVHCHGFQSDRSKIYSNIDICVVPSRFQEPFGMVAIEAGMAGIPCVATRRGGLPEIIEDGVTGLLVEAERPKQLSSALERLIRDPGLRDRMGAAARERVQERFSRERFLQQFAALLEK